jgi:hypothetical protein
MACGCGKTNAGRTQASCGVALPIIYLERSAMCRACPERAGDGLGTCGLAGKPVEVMIQRGGCPIWAFPIAGIVRWLGVRWRGVPYPIRLYLWVRHGTHPAKWPGCGCLHVPKSLYERIVDGLSKRLACRL